MNSAPAPVPAPGHLPAVAGARRLAMVPPVAEGSLARFADDFGKRVMLTIDTEEEFDWSAPFSRAATATTHVRAFAGFQALCEEIGAHPIWLVDWPIANDPVAINVLGEAVARGRADIGIHLHPWVNPPFDEELNAFNSYAGNLPPDLEAAKFEALKERIESRFGIAPRIYRAGRYGLGPHSIAMLARHGIAIDSSVRTLFEYSADGGPDYRQHPAHPFWADARRQVLELPVTSVHAGRARRLGTPLHGLAGRVPGGPGVLSRLRLLERIALTPEGVLAADALRGIEAALEQELPLLVLSLHSPSLVPGHTPYTKKPAQVDALHDWLRIVYADLARRGVSSAGVDDVLAALRR